MNTVSARPVRKLSRAGSRRFVEIARANFVVLARPVYSLSKVLGCSLKTARRILKPVDVTFRIRDSYAVRLAAHLGMSKRAMLRVVSGDMAEDFFAKWPAANTALDNREAARKLGQGAERIAVNSYELPCELSYVNHVNFSTALVILRVIPYPDPDLIHTFTFSIRDGYVEVAHQYPNGRPALSSKANLPELRKMFATIANLRKKNELGMPI